MKELTIEEKAKAYDEAFKEASVAHKDEDRHLKATLERIFPELKESEDEKVRKELIKLMRKISNTIVENYTPVPISDFVAWLEKQDKNNMGISETTKQELEDNLHKSLEKETPESCNEFLEKQGKKKPLVVPKFRVGDTIKNKKTNKIFTISDYSLLCEYYHDINHYHEIKFSEQDDWELVEQKPADKVEPKFKVGDSISKKHNSDINKFGIFTITSIADNKYWYNDSVVCDFSDQDLWELVECPKFKKGDWVFHNTAEFIYMIQTIGRDGYGVISRDGKKSVVYYSAEINYRLWTIQDAKDGDILYAKGNYFKEYLFMFSSFTEDNVISTHFGYDVFHRTFDKKLTRFGREEDFVSVIPATKEQRDTLMKAIADAGYTFDFEKKELKKIEQKPVEEIRGNNGGISPNSEWSEEDISMIGGIRSIIEKYAFSQSAVDVNGELCEQEYIDADNWLKSLKDRYTWKPSDEQIECLSDAIKHYNSLGYPATTLKELLNNLLKLREE